MKFTQAVEAMQAARARIQTATTKKAKREAQDDFEFYSNKAAMLDVMARKGMAA